MLVVTPTRELAQQIDDAAQDICAYTHHSTVVLVGGVSYEGQREALNRGCDLLVATPGRLLDLMAQGEASLDHVQVLVLDEADHMLDMGFLPDVSDRYWSRSPHTVQDTKAPGGEHSYRLVVSDAGGNTISTDPVTVTVEPGPDAPEVVQASDTFDRTAQ